MVKIIFGCLILALGLTIGCDDNDGRFSGDCGFPPVEDFPECPANAFMERHVCERISCRIGDPDVLDFAIFLIDIPSCEFPDCFTASCNVLANGEVLDAIFFNLENFGMDLVSIDGGDPVEYNNCLTVVP